MRDSQTVKAQINAKREALRTRPGACEVCGWVPPSVRGVPLSGILNLHHIVPLRRGGSSDPDNLILLCATCHSIAHAGMPSTTGRMEYCNADELRLRTKGDLVECITHITNGTYDTYYQARRRVVMWLNPAVMAART